MSDDKKEILVISVDIDNEVRITTHTIGDFSAKMLMKHWGDAKLIEELPEHPDPDFWPSPSIFAVKFKRIRVEVSSTPIPPSSDG